jgi:hypothetical protein
MIKHSFLIFTGPVETMVFKQFDYLEYFQDFYQNLVLEPIQLLMNQILALSSVAADFKQMRFCSSCLQILQLKISSMGLSFFTLNHSKSYRFK